MKKSSHKILVFLFALFVLTGVYACKVSDCDCPKFSVDITKDF